MVLPIAFPILAPPRMAPMHLGRARELSQTRTLRSTLSYRHWSQDDHPSADTPLEKPSVGHRIPAFDIPLAFLSSLRANLQISLDELNHTSSSVESLNSISDGFGSTEGLRHPARSQELPTQASLSPDVLEFAPPSPTTTSTSNKSLASPLIWTYHASTDDDRSEALRLIADSIVQQRLLAVRSILLHPAVLTLSLLILTILVRSAYRNPLTNGPVVSVIGAMLVAAALIALHRATRRYMTLAEIVRNPCWLKEGLYLRNNHGGGDGSAGGFKNHNHRRGSLMPEDEILLTKYHDEIVGVLVLRTARTNALTSGAPSANGRRALRHRHSNSNNASVGRLTGVIRAWTVTPSHRYRGIGIGLLESAVSICRTRRLDGPIFADERLHSAHIPGFRMLPWPFNADFQKMEDWATGLLRDVIEGQGL